MAELLSSLDPLGVLQSCEPETQDLILTLLQEDVENSIEQSKGKEREGAPNTQAVIASLLETGLATLRSAITDARMAVSLSQAVIEDAPIINQLQLENDQAEQDRTFALELSRGSAIPPASYVGRATAVINPTSSYDQLPKALIDELEDLCMGESVKDSYEDEEQLENTPDSSTWHAAKRTAGNSSLASLSRTCEACRERCSALQSLRAPCDHSYCGACISALFEAATQDESLFPPRCCRQPITLASVQWFLSPRMHATFEQKSIEFLVRDRTYCFKTTCNRFLPPSIGTTAAEPGRIKSLTCATCSSQTCTSCKKQSHLGECPDDEAYAALLRSANALGWQQCQACKRMIELSTGCNHIT